MNKKRRESERERAQNQQHVVRFYVKDKQQLAYTASRISYMKNLQHTFQ